jgi:hypothetical protein
MSENYVDNLLQKTKEILSDNEEKEKDVEQ